MPSYLFDVDGTLTSSRQRIDKDFAVWFSRFCENNKVYLVTGSDKPKTIEQVGEYIYFRCKKVYQCSGNDVWAGDTQLKTQEVKWHAHTLGFFSNELNESVYPIKTGIHVDYRAGLINFSIVGRRATADQRANYTMYDKQVNERLKIADRFNKQFPQYQASVAGETGIDIVPRGSHKGQIITDFDFSHDIHFFGDKCDKGGNDYELAMAVDERGGSTHKVNGWEDTWKILKEL
tara:strand:- start:2213 stop:2911 length:699 start_codon:yes stop_codon:yes gene_type:complete